jgi:hypothetical protein
MLTFINIFFNIVFNFFSNPIYLAILMCTISINFIAKYTYDTKLNNSDDIKIDNSDDFETDDIELDYSEADDIELDYSDDSEADDIELDYSDDSEADDIKVDDSEADNIKVDDSKTNDKQPNNKELDSIDDLEIIEALDYSNEVDLRSTNNLKYSI